MTRVNLVVVAAKPLFFLRIVIGYITLAFPRSRPIACVIPAFTIALAARRRLHVYIYIRLYPRGFGSFKNNHPLRRVARSITAASGSRLGRGRQIALSSENGNFEGTKTHVQYASYQVSTLEIPYTRITLLYYSELMQITANNALWLTVEN